MQGHVPIMLLSKYVFIVPVSHRSWGHENKLDLMHTIYNIFISFLSHFAGKEIKMLKQVNMFPLFQCYSIMNFKNI